MYISKNFRKVAAKIMKLQQKGHLATRPYIGKEKVLKKEVFNKRLLFDLVI